MKTLLIISTLIYFTAPLIGQTINPYYDSTLAKKLGADDYGMKMYILVILKTGSNETQDKSLLDSLFSGHFEAIKLLSNEGKLIVAGPLTKNDKSYRGIFILNVTSIEEANKLVQLDPIIRAKVLEADLYEWYGSAALSEYLKTHKKIEKVQIK